MTNTAYHPHTSGQVKRNHIKFFARVKRYESKQQDKWGLIVQPLMHEYSTQLYGSSGVPRFCLALTRHLSAAAIFPSPSVILLDLSFNVSFRIVRSLLHLSLMTEKVDNRSTTQEEKHEDVDEYVGKTRNFKLSKQILVDWAPLAIKNYFRCTNNPAYNSLMSKADELFYFITVQQQRLTSHTSGAPNRISTDRKTHGSLKNTYVGVGKVQTSFKKRAKNCQ